MSVSGMLRAVSKSARGGVTSYCCRRVMYSTEYKNRFYTKKHEWVSLSEADNIATVGISSFAQEALGEVVFAQLPGAGAALSAGDECGALESVKAAAELYTPVSGTVTQNNSDVESTPALINQACYGDGWLFKVRLTRPNELEQLMDQKSYDQFLQESH